MGQVSPELLRAQKLTYFSWTWDEAYSNILLRKDLEANTTITASTALTVDEDTYHDTTVDFIFPWKYDYVTIINGVAEGNVKITVYSKGGSDHYRETYCKVTVTLLAVTSAGAERTLGTAVLSEVLADAGATPNEEVTIVTDVPFFMSLDTEVLNEEKLVMRVLFQARWVHVGAGTQGSPASSVTYHTALNSNNISIILPRVPKGA